MRYFAAIIIAAASLVVFGCSGSLTDNSKVAAMGNDMSTPVPAPTQTSTTGVGECKICGFDISSYKGELKKEEIDGLLLALNDEYMAIAIYQQVNRDFNDPRPFVNIVEAEKRHAERLKVLFTKYGIPIPENPWPGKVSTYKTVAEACKAGVDAEIANRDLYTRLFKTTERQDILDTYRALQRASEENHLPAFQRCGGGGGGRGPGNGRGPRGNE